jgi:SAM-dependent methyltransferase
MRTELESLGVPKEALLLEAFRYTGDLSTPPPRNFPDWDTLYRTHPGEEMPWHYPDLDPDVARALDTQRIESGRALDVGTGTGTQAIALAARGFDVTGTDISPAAAAAAAQRAAERNARARFLADDVLSSRLADRFDLILDRGCFHVLAPERRPDYVRAMADRLAPAGHLFLKCFADDEPEGSGPHRFSPDDIRTLFAPTFEVVDITRTVYQGTLERAPRALFCILRPR